MSQDDIVKKVIRSEWSQIGMVLITVSGLSIWNRTESRADIRHMDAKLESFRHETTSIINGMRQDMRDFHGRLERQDAEFKSGLLRIEERNIKQ